MSAYAANPSAAAYRERSVLTASPAQLVVMLYDGAGRFLLQAATAMRAEDQVSCDAKLRRAEAVLDELPLDARQGSRRRDRQPPRGHLRLLPPSSDRGAHRARRRDDRQGRRAARRAARVLGADRRAPDMSSWQDLAGARGARARAGGRRPLGGARRAHGRADAHQRVACRRPRARRAPLLARLAELQAELSSTLTDARADTVRELGSLRRGQTAVRGYAPAAGPRPAAGSTSRVSSGLKVISRRPMTGSVRPRDGARVGPRTDRRLLQGIRPPCCSTPHNPLSRPPSPAHPRARRRWPRTWPTPTPPATSGSTSTSTPAWPPR